MMELKAENIEWVQGTGEGAQKGSFTYVIKLKDGQFWFVVDPLNGEPIVGRPLSTDTRTPQGMLVTLAISLRAAMIDLNL